jgi:hypothetical protein
MKKLLTIILILASLGLKAQTIASLNTRITAIEKSFIDTSVYNRLVDSLVSIRVTNIVNSAAFRNAQINSIQGWVNDKIRPLATKTEVGIITTNLIALQVIIKELQEKPDATILLKVKLAELALQVNRLINTLKTIQ